jgi:hypothetical protein
MVMDRLIGLSSFFFSGAIVGLFVYHFFFIPEVEIINTTVTETKTDTVYQVVKDTVLIQKTDIIHVYEKDTVIIDYKPTINTFSGRFPTLYGNIDINGRVLGKVLNIGLISSQKIPSINTLTTVTDTKTILVKPKGLYVGASIDNFFNPSIGASYLDNQYIFNYSYNVNLKSHQIGVHRKLF